MPNLANSPGMKYFFVLLWLTLCTGLAAQDIVEKPEFEKFYAANKVDGCFLLFDVQHAQTYVYNKSKIDSGFIPASTFKILNSLIFLETGVVTDEYAVIPWDSVNRQVAAWNKSQSLREAFSNSTVWIYQKFAREVGNTKMQELVTKARYGNENINGGIDKFWLTGNLRITPREQMDFLIRLYNNQLPFSAKTIQRVKSMLVYREYDSIIYRGKTGWGTVNDIDYGWWVGYISSGENVWFFVNLIECKDQDNPSFASARKAIAESIFRELGIVSRQFTY